MLRSGAGEGKKKLSVSYLAGKSVNQLPTTFQKRNLEISAKSLRILHFLDSASHLSGICSKDINMNHSRAIL